MGEVSIIGLDLAKNVFQAHGAGSDGSVARPNQIWVMDITYIPTARGSALIVE